MSWHSWVARRRRSVASATAMSVITSTFAVAALFSDGFPTTDVNLDDGAVWVTNADVQLVGRLNRQIDELVSSAAPSGGNFDVLQEASTVFVTTGPKLESLDVASSTLGAAIDLPADPRVAMGGGTVGVLDREDGRLWVRTSETVGGLDVSADPPDATLGRDGLLTVGQDGAAHALSVEKRELVTLRPGGAVDRFDLGEIPTDAADLDLTAVGGRAVVLDRAKGRLLRKDADPVAVDVRRDARLQEPGPSAGTVLLATSEALVEMPLDKGELRVTPVVKGAPARPVRLGGCLHAAWSGSSVYARSCGGEPPTVQQIPGAAPTAELVFRTNRQVVVLNDTSVGGVWLVDEDLKSVTNWEDVKPDPEKDSESEKQDSQRPDVLDERIAGVVGARDKPNQPPQANPDEFGVRAGRSTALPVLGNDVDLDGDLLTVERTDPAVTTPVGTLARVAAQSALQLDVPAGKQGETTFSYDISDGRGGSSSASVKVRVVPDNENDPPRPAPDGVASTAVVEQGGSVTTDVLRDWIDPDGDDLVLTGAAVGPDSGATVQFRADGSVTFVDSGTSVGTKTVALTVSDGRAEATGKLLVSVTPRGPQPPVAVADRVVAFTGRPTLVRPLDNDRDPNADALRLVSVTPVEASAPLKITEDFAAGTFTVLSDAPGTYYLTYAVSDGPAVAVGLVRVDVLPSATQNAPPVAVGDRVLLPAGRKVEVDVLANDEDPDGDVLLVTGVSGDAQQGLVVEVLSHRVLAVSARRALTGPVTLRYVVSDGALSDEGTVTVTPVPAGTPQQPIALPDVATVRAGDVVTIPVLENDSHPEGDDLVLDPVLVEDVGPEQGRLTVDDTVLRFQAPTQAGTVSAVYRISDSRGDSASASVTIYVRARDGKNAPPQPRDVEARAFAGQTLRITVPLVGIDPDGDSVTLIGADSAPRLGRVARTGPDWIDYEAFPTAGGTDTFTYAVEDTFGARGLATVRVGVAQRSANQPPVAVDDLVAVRPGRQVQVDVLVNDSDPDGDPLSFATPALQMPAGVEATAQGSVVSVRAPSQTGVVAISYTIVDGRGGTATAFLSVDVRDDADLAPPVARDDVVTADQVADRSAVDVPVLDNDEDPDGRREDLKVRLPGAPVGVEMLGDTQLRIWLTAEPQTVVYSAVDADGLTDEAFVRVPALDGAAPRRNPAAPALEVESGLPLPVDLGQQVLVRPGRTARLTQQDRVSATNGSVVVDSPVEVTFTSAPGYVGPASVSVEVTDGSGPEDPQGRRALVTLPVTVRPVGGSNDPPVFAPAALRVAAGEPAALDLRTSVTDPNPDDELVFNGPSGMPPGISARLEGATLRVMAESSVPKGTTAVLEVSVRDGTNEPVSGQVAVEVTASTRPLVQAIDDPVDGASGRSLSVSVLANDAAANPFPETPLRLVGQPQVESGQTLNPPTYEGNNLVVTPGNDFFGTLVVRYTVQDATGDVDRQVDGRVLVTVAGRPGRPASPVVESEADRTVVLTWPAPPMNGGEFKTYVVRSVSGGFTQDCPGTTCSLQGLTNNVEYQFTVTARNAVGDSEPGPPSAVARPDVRPGRPQAPTLVFGDRQLDVAWVEPASLGSQVSSYGLEISPPGQTASVTVTGATSYTWRGLKNGTPYQVRVRAFNRLAEQPSDWSEYSQLEVPAGVPDAPAKPTAEKAGGNIGQQVKVYWAAPAANNGDAVSGYELLVFRSGTQTQTIPVSAATTTQTITAENGQDYTFQVIALNKAGRSVPSVSSVSITPSGQPGTISSVTAAPGDRQAALTFVVPSDNGEAIRGFQYSVNAGAWTALAADKVVRGLSNNALYTFRVRALNSFPGDPSPPTDPPVEPFGQPGVPSVTVRDGGDKVLFDYQPPARNGRNITKIEFSIDGGGWQTGTATGGTAQSGAGYYTTHSIRLRATDELGQVGEVSQPVSGSTGINPGRKVTVSKGTTVAKTDYCTVAECRAIVVDMTGFQPNTTYTLYFSTDCNTTNPASVEPCKVGGITRYKSEQRTTDGSGRFFGDTRSFGYNGAQVWVEVEPHYARSNNVQW